MLDTEMIAHRVKITILLALLLMAIYATASYAALDPPHSPNINYHCNDCHFTDPNNPPSWYNGPNDPTTDDTPLNRLCATCHQGAIAQQEKTHSAYALGDYSYGTWNLECVDCHNPHYQRQIRRYGSISYNYTGTSTNILIDQPQTGQSQLVEAGAGWTTDQWKDMVLIPNTALWYYMYRIAGNTADTITVDGIINATAGSTFAIAYGKNIKDVINSKNVKFITDYDSGANKSGFIQDDYTGICQVCHTQTSYWRTDGTEPAPNHNVNQACINCHVHTDGLKASGSCDTCHGNPPVVSTLGGPNGLANSEGGTGSTSPGAHQLHATSGNLNYSCETCHTGGMPTSPIYDKTIQIGFNAFNTYQTGTYDGRATLANGYTYGAGNAGTTVTQGGSWNCSNIYCHSNVQGQADGTGNPTSYGTPTWNNSASVQCGSCHNADGVQGNATLMATGTHTAHVDPVTYNKTCSTCHSGAGSGTTVHVNNLINVSIDATYGGSYNGDGAGNHAPGLGYGGCSNLYCHSDARTPTYTSPSWGGAALNCTGCHGGAGGSTGGAGTTLTTSHTVHTNTSGFAYTCNYCHTTTASDNTVIADYTRHVNKVKNVAVAASVGGTGTDGGDYSAGTCSTINCHGSASTDWTTGGTTGDCSLCHGMEANPSDGRDTNGDTANTDSEVGAHVAHLNNTHGLRSTGISCSECHTVPSGATYIDKVKATGHIDSSLPAEVPVNGTLATNNGAMPSYSGAPGGSCSNTYCHDGRNFKNGWSTVAQIEFETPDWNTPIMDGTINDCDNCHGNPPGGGHPASSNCTSCHSHVNATNNGFTDATLHINGSVEGGGDCIGCHSSQQGTGRRSVTADFSKTSHHVSTGMPTNVLTCEACHGDLLTDRGHPGSATTDPITEVENADTAGTYYSINPSTADANLKTFCLSCHDANGATRLGANALRPFADSGDTTAPPNINLAWTNTYNHSANATCNDCHGDNSAAGTTLDPRYNMHGSANANLLRGATEYDTCVTNSCHGAGGSATTEMPTELSGTGGKHPIGQQVTPRSSRLRGDTNGSMFVNGWTKDSVAQCSDCHGMNPAGSNNVGPRGPHGSAYVFMLRGADTSINFVTSGRAYGTPKNSSATTNGTRENFCINCHASDVYSLGDSNQTTPSNETLSWVAHYNDGTTRNVRVRPRCGGNSVDGNRNLGAKLIHVGCLNCHAGGRHNYGAHSSTWGAGWSGGTGLMNGAAWSQQYTSATCYANADATWSNCNQGNHN